MRYHILFLLFLVQSVYAQNILIELKFQLSPLYKQFFDEQYTKKRIAEEYFPQMIEQLEKDQHKNIHFFLEGYHTNLPHIHTKLDIIIKDTIFQKTSKDTSWMDFYRVYEYNLPKHLIPPYTPSIVFPINEPFPEATLKRVWLAIMARQIFFLPFDKKNKNISEKDIAKKAFFRNVLIRMKGDMKDSNVIRLKNIIDKRCAYHQAYYAQRHQNKRYFNYYLLYESEKAPVLNDLIEFEVEIIKIDTLYRVNLITDPKKVETFFHPEIDFKDFSSFSIPKEIIQKSNLQTYQKIGVITGLILNNVDTFLPSKK